MLLFLMIFEHQQYKGIPKLFPNGIGVIIRSDCSGIEDERHEGSHLRSRSALTFGSWRKPAGCGLAEAASGQGWSERASRSGWPMAPIVCAAPPSAHPPSAASTTPVT